MNGIRIRRRPVALALLVALAPLVGCGGGMRELERNDLLQPEDAKSYRVTTVDGGQYTFIALHLEGETLMGTERITDTRVVGEGDDAREVVSNRYEERRIPWADVSRVEADTGGTRSGGLWLLAGSVAVGVAAFFILSASTDDGGDNGGGTKPPPGN